MILKARTITADRDGPYKLAYRVRLYNDPAQGAFDGTAGGFATWITINNEQASLRQLQLIYRGAKIDGGFTYVDSNDDQIIYLKKDDKLHVRFYTYGTWNINSDTKNIYISKGQSYIKLWRL